MGKGTSESTQQTTQSSYTQPWQDTIPTLQGIIGGIKGQLGNVNPTSAETGAFNTIQNNYANAPNYGTQATNLATQLLGNTTGQASDALTGAYNQSSAALSPYLNPGYLDPTKTPGIQGLLDTIRSDVSNSVNGMFAGAGRDLSGLNTQTLARGIAQGEAQPLLDQYNANVQAQQNAAGQLQGGANAYAQTLQGLTQQGLANQQAGISAGVSAPDVMNNNAQGILSAQNQQRQLPLQNLGMLANLTVPIAGLGGQSAGSSSTVGTQTMSPLQQAMGYANIASSLFGANAAGGGGNGSLNAIKSFFSDRRMKDDIEQIGELYDGTPIYRFRYKGDPRVTIGLMADDVERSAPDAVGEFAGIKVVDYGAATNRAAAMGAK